MTRTGSAADSVFGTVLEASHVSQARDLPRMLDDAAQQLGCHSARMFLIDYDQVLLVELPPDDVAQADLHNVEGSLAGRAFAELTPQISTDDESTLVWVPMLDGTERLGVVQYLVDGSDVGTTQLEQLRHLAALMTFVLVSKNLVGDLVERTRRRLPMSLPAEIQWRLLPPLTFATDHVVVSGVVLPTHDVAGDSFDYAVNDVLAHVAVFDAMGHGLEATLYASVAIGALRNARRAGLGLSDTVHSIDSLLGHTFGNERFVTGIIGELDIGSGTWTWVSAGHPPALLLRGGKTVKVLEGGLTTPLGLQWAQDVQPGRERLEPGDRLLLHTDGVLEARNEDGEMFGAERLGHFVSRALSDGRPAPETLRRLNLAILEHQSGLLQDDATTVLLDWSGAGSDRLRG